MTDRTPCECRCGYRCGGPGRCKLGVVECLQQAEGHYVRDCDHKWDGPHVYHDADFVVVTDQRDAFGMTATCSVCGLWSDSHDMRVGP